MRLKIIIFLMIVLSSAGVQAQTLKGSVTDAATGKPLNMVTIVNVTTEQSTSTDELGIYSIPAKSGDVISFSYIGYNTIQRIATPGIELNIMLTTLSVQLKEFIIHPDYTPFQKDSVEIATLYSKELNVQRIKPHVGINNEGIGASGLIGSAVQKMSRSYKKSKKFKEAFLKDEEQKYIDTKYRPELVTAITGFTGDTLALFMNTYPMEYAFARSASELELRMWIRDNYKEYLHKRTE